MLFRHAASRVVRGVPLLLAVAIFAVAYHPIRHAADVKPYASDLLAALVLLAAAFDWWRAPERAGWMWGLAAVSPIAIALSHPAVFVAGGIMLGLFPSVVKAGQRVVWIAYATFAMSTVSMFLGLFAIFIHAQAAATLTTMQVPWASGFPPLDDPAGAGPLARDCSYRRHVRLSLRGREGSEQPDRVAVRRGRRRVVVPRSGR